MVQTAGLSDLIDMDVSDRPQPEGDMALSAEHRSRRDAPHPPPGNLVHLLA